MAVAMLALTISLVTFNNIAVSYQMINFASEALPKEPSCISEEIQSGKSRPSLECAQQIVNSKKEMINRL